MKVKVTDPIKDYDGKDIVEKDSQGKEIVLTWRPVIGLVLNTLLKDEIMPPDQKVKAFEISVKTFSTEELDYTIEEAAFILERIQKFYNPLICGRAREIFEGK